MEADNQSKEVEIGGRRGNSRSIDDVRCEGEEERGGKGEAPNITQQLIALKQIQAQKGRPTNRSVMFYLRKMCPNRLPQNGSSLVAVAYIHVNLSRHGAPVKRDEGRSINNIHPKEDAVRARVAGLIECESVPNADRGVSKNLQTFQNVINGWPLTGDKRPTPLFAAGCGGGEPEKWRTA